MLAYLLACLHDVIFFEKKNPIHCDDCDDCLFFAVSIFLLPTPVAIFYDVTVAILDDVIHVLSIPFNPDIPFAVFPSL